MSRVLLSCVPYLSFALYGCGLGTGFVRDSGVDPVIFLVHGFVSGSLAL